MQIRTIILAAATFSMTALASPVDLSARTGGTSVTPEQCTTDNKVQKCCNSAGLVSNLLVGLGGLLGGLGLVGDDLVGLGCLNLGSTCSAQTVCCSGEQKTVNTLINIEVIDLDCVPINVL